LTRFGSYCGEQDERTPTLDFAIIGAELLNNSMIHFNAFTIDHFSVFSDLIFRVSETHFAKAKYQGKHLCSAGVFLAALKGGCFAKQPEKGHGGRP